MKKVITKLVSAVAFSILAALSVIQPLNVSADVPYETFSQDGYGDYIKCQTAYTPVTSIYKFVDPATEDVYYMSNASDMMLGNDGYLYVVDTDNSRIVVGDTSGNYIKTIGSEDTLYEPSGIYVTSDGNVYVCCPKESRRASSGYVAVFDSEGNLIAKYGTPTSVLYGEETFKPSKIIVDKGGTMYIVATGNTNGIVEITPDDGGTFLGYFGTGDIYVTIADVIKNLVLSDSQLARLAKKVPQTNKNLCIDEKGIIYTLVEGITTQTQPLKKLNKAGSSMITLEVMPYYGQAVAVGAYSNIYVATSTGVIYEYSEEGVLLFRFGGTDSTNSYRTGLYTSSGSPQAIDVDDNDYIYILYNINGSAAIDIFKPTEFADYVHKSLGYYQSGDYTNTKLYLERVINMNSMFDYANQAMGLALYREENYSESMAYYRLAKDTLGYSDAYWEIRNTWLTHNVVYLVLIILVIFFAIRLLKAWDKKKGIFNPIRKLTKPMRDTLAYKRLVFGCHFMRHPIDGAYEIKHYGLASIVFSYILIAVYTIIYIINKYFAGFLVKTVKDGRYQVTSDVMIWFIGIITIAAFTYLMCTINDGEGKFKEIFTGYVYSMTPYLFIQPILFVIGKVVTNNEMFIYSFINLIMIVYIVILMFIAIKEINNYSVGETFKIILLTAFAMLVFALIMFVIYILIQQLASFARSIYGEVVYRIEN